MKVLFVNKFYHPVVGGVETVVRQYAEALAGAGHQATVLCASGKPSLKTETSEVNGVQVIRAPSLGTWLSMPCAPFLPLTFARIMDSFDIVHFHEPFPLGSLCSFLIPPASRRKFKVLVTWHSDIVRQKLFKRPAQALQRRLLGLSDRVLCSSQRLACSSGVLPEFSGKLSVLPLSIDPKAYGPSSKRVAEASGEFLLYFGRLAGYKGLPVLLDAFAKCRLPEGLKLVVAGDGSMADFIAARIRDSDLNGKVVLIRRRLDEEEKKDLLSRCLFYVFPSTLPTEAFGITQLEAMAYGKPVVNTDLPTGVPWVSVHGVSGLTVPPGDIEALSRAIETLSSDKSLRDSLGSGAKARLLELFSNATALREYLRLCSELLGA